MIEQKLKTKDVENGEELSLDEIDEIRLEANAQVRQELRMNVKTRNRQGEVEDYLEVRRPLGSMDAKI